MYLLFQGRKDFLAPWPNQSMLVFTDNQIRKKCHLAGNISESWVMVVDWVDLGFWWPGDTTDLDLSGYWKLLYKVLSPKGLCRVVSTTSSSISSHLRPGWRGWGPLLMISDLKCTTAWMHWPDLVQTHVLVYSLWALKQNKRELNKIWVPLSQHIWLK